VDTDPISEVLEKVIEEIWAEYDKDNNGYLDKDEARVFVAKTIQDLDVENGTFDEEAFE